MEHQPSALSDIPVKHWVWMLLSIFDQSVLPVSAASWRKYWSYIIQAGQRNFLLRRAIMAAYISNDWALSGCLVSRTAEYIAKHCIHVARSGMCFLEWT